MTKVALITGVTGQDGSYLAESLLKKGYIVHGIKRRSSSINTDRIDHLYEDIEVKSKKFHLHYGDLADSLNISQLITSIMPDEIYNLGAQSHVAVSFEVPEYTANVDALGTLRILDTILKLKKKKNIKFYQASTSELFGDVVETPQSETTPFNPVSPYAVAKLYSYWICKNYRDAYDIFACNGILFNHESPRRGETFVTRKITLGISKILSGKRKFLFLGNLDSLRDWGHAKDFVEMQWLMLQQENPQDFVIATGKQYSVRQFLVQCFKVLGITIRFEGKGVNEVGIVDSVENAKVNLKENQIVVKVSADYFRPLEVNSLLGDASKAQEILGWAPKINFEALCKEMIESDCKHYTND